MALQQKPVTHVTPTPEAFPDIDAPTIQTRVPSADQVKKTGVASLQVAPAGEIDAFSDENHNAKEVDVLHGHHGPERAPTGPQAILMNETNPGRVLHCIDEREGRPTTELITLRPGANSISLETLDMLRKSRTVAQWVRLKYLRLPKPKKEGSPGLAGFDDSEALTIIAECFNPSLLVRWLDAEKRDHIREAIRDRRVTLERALSREDDPGYVSTVTYDV